MTLPDFIDIRWHIDDVKILDSDREDESTPSLTDEQCRKVLQAALNNHDATIGINWDVLQYHIQQIREE